jgi:hypothetical protein
LAVAVEASMPSSVSKHELLAEVGVDHAAVARDGLRCTFGDLLAMVKHHDALGQPIMAP